MIMKKYKITIILITVLSSLSSAVAFAQTDSLNHYLQAAVQNNPGIKAGLLIYRAALQRLPQAAAFQDPQLEAGFFLRPMDIIDGRQVGQFQLMQMFPWFGTRKAARTEAQHMANMAFEQFRETRDNVLLEIYTQWYMLCSLEQKLKNSRENAALLKQLETLTLQKFKSSLNSSQTAVSQRMESSSVPVSPDAGSSSGSMSAGMNMGGTQMATESPVSASEQTGNSMSMSGTSSGMSEALRIRLEMTELDAGIESLLSEIRAGKARFNGFLNRPAETEVILPDSIVQIMFTMDGETAMNLIAQQNPVLGMISEESLAYGAKADMDRKMGYPMFGIGLQYMLINKKTPAAGTPDSGTEHGVAQGNAGMMSMNGKDMVMPMLSVSIPVFRSKYRALRRETELLQQASEEKYTDALNTLQAELYRAKHQLDDATRKIALYRRQSELAQTAYNIALQEFISGKSELGSVIQIQRQLLDYQLKTAEATAEYNTKVAVIHRMISITNYELK
jgi:hypothetical protein